MFGPRAQLAYDLVAIHTRHIDIGYDDVDILAFEHVDPVLAIVGDKASKEVYDKTFIALVKWNVFIIVGILALMAYFLVH